MATSEVKFEDIDKLPEHSWIVRVCEDYYEQYRDCKSIKAKFHQYFIFGSTLDCSEWNNDYKACMKYRNNKDTESLQSVIDSERQRKIKRLQAHYANDVWEKRAAPPEDWNKVIPNNLQNGQESHQSFLALKMKELREKNLIVPFEETSSKSSCVVS